LIEIVSDLKKELEQCKTAKDGAEKLLERFKKEVEQNPRFIACRKYTAWGAVYEQIAASIKLDIQAECAKQTVEKKKQFQEAVAKLRNDVKMAQPQDKKSGPLKNELELIKRNRYFDRIKKSEGYKNEVSRLDNQIYILHLEENKYFSAKRKKAGLIVAVVVALLVLGYFLFK
jgi:hypothetical protein